MPIPAANEVPTPKYQFKNRNRLSFSFSGFKGRKGRLLILAGAILVALVLAYITTKNQAVIREFISNQTKTEEVPVVNKETGELTPEVRENIDKITIEQVKEASKSSGINALNSPDLSDSEKSVEIYKKIGNDKPENHILAYSDFGLSLASVEIKQGDLVTWANNSTEPMSIVGDGWQSNTPREPNDQFSYGFVFLGEYKYKINDKTEGVITVVQ